MGPNDRPPTYELASEVFSSMEEHCKRKLMLVALNNDCRGKDTLISLLTPLPTKTQKYVLRNQHK
ncbi:hypothetical protein AB205_0042500 [Aquarana catesbeiana]|uniref:Uncharacterized protein n=1 Tax=Aquarana catesbeiana TaxID=8400 RepID=A0A2G9RY84_AQUCT|nr:hypothetical protein AB205_0042500 [Aquarana catesbeiana]